MTLTRSRSQTQTSRSAPFSSARRPLPSPRGQSLQAAPGPVLRRRPHLRRAALSLAEDGSWGGSVPDVGAGSRRPDTASPPVPASSPPGPLSPLSLRVPSHPALVPFTYTPHRLSRPSHRPRPPGAAGDHRAPDPARPAPKARRKPGRIPHPHTPPPLDLGCRRHPLPSQK